VIAIAVVVIGGPLLEAIHVAKEQRASAPRPQRVLPLDDLMLDLITTRWRVRG
jgi:hypothetical protein